MKKLILTTLTLISLPLFSQEVDSQTVSKMLQQFQDKGILNAEQAEAAKSKLNQITPDQWAQIRKQAESMKAEGRVPAQTTTNNVDAAAKMIDPNSPEFKETMGKLKGILDQQKRNLEDTEN